MNKRTCLVVTDKIRDLANEIRKQYSQLENLSDERISEMVGLYAGDNNLSPDYIPTPSQLVNFMEKKYNAEGKSLINPQPTEIQFAMDSLQTTTVEYTKQGGTKQVYTVVGTRIYNKEGKEVYPADAPNAGADRNAILFKAKFQNGSAVKLTYGGVNYVVDKEGNIFRVDTKHIMNWPATHGDRIRIIQQAANKFLDNEVKAQKSAGLDITGFVNHSGGAYGSDSYWGMLAEKLGIPSRHYYHGLKTPKGNTLQSDADFKEGIEKAKKAASDMGRKWLDEYADLLARNWNQVKYADAVFAVGHIIKPGEKNKKGYTVKAVQVDGGTGYAVQMAINEGKLVYVFDQERGRWFKHENSKWDYSDTPTLTENYAGIGTRDITVAGLNAILDVYEKTFKRKFHAQRVVNQQLEQLERITGTPVHLSSEFKAYLDNKENKIAQEAIEEKREIKSATDNNGDFSKENDDIQAFETVGEDGKKKKIYGFITPKGEIYLDETAISPEHPLHEYTHIWDRVVAMKNPKFWKTGISLFKRAWFTDENNKRVNLWNWVANNSEYGLKWKQMVKEGKLEEEKVEGLIASEVHARLVGKRGKETLAKIVKDKGSEGIIEKLKQWLVDFWKQLKSAFMLENWDEGEEGNKKLKKFEEWAEKDVDKALEYLSDITVYDFATGVNPLNLNKNQQGQNNDEKAGVMKDLIAESQTSTTSVQRNTPITFKFKDGTEVKAPFKPNSQQEDALNAMDEFIKSNKTTMTLSGYAGTGKTSLMEILAEKMQKQHKRMVFCATTNEAAKILGDRVRKSGFEAMTVHKAFGMIVTVDPDADKYDSDNVITIEGNPNIGVGDTVVIDEASMLSEENYDTLNKIAKANNLKIIYTGDAAQLPPVGENQISEVFRDQNHDVVTLTIVERTGDNAILREATNLREGKELSMKSSFNADGQGVAYMKSSNIAGKNAIINNYVPGLKQNPNYFRILAGTNAAIASYNAQIRRQLDYYDNVPRVGEPITGYTNWGYIYRPGGKSTYRFINSETYNVVKVGKPKDVSMRLPDGSLVTMHTVPIIISNGLDKTDTVNFMDIKGDLENLANAKKLVEAKDQLWTKARASSGRAKAQLLSQINTIEEFLFVNDNVYVDGRRVQKKVFDFGYALTIHKSQGSTFTHVLVDIDDVENSFKEKGGNPIIAPDGTTIYIGGPSVDIQRKLKYVAVSRATDTVTIVSNKVKNEDSPLNHINGGAVVNNIPQSPAPQQPSQASPAPTLPVTDADRQKLIEETLAQLNASAQALGGFGIPSPQSVMPQQPSASPQATPQVTPQVTPQPQPAPQPSVSPVMDINEAAKNAIANTFNAPVVPQEKPKKEKPESDEIKSELNPKDNRMTRFYNTFTPQQMRDRAMMIADKFSSLIDTFQKNEVDRLKKIANDETKPDEEREEAWKMLQDYTDPATGRQKIVETYQVGTILDRIRKSLERTAKSFETKGGQENLLKAKKYRDTVEFFDELFNSKVSLFIEDYEGIVINDLQKIDKTAQENANDEASDGNDETGHVVTGNDGWIFQIRYEDPANTLSKTVRRIIGRLRRPNTETDDLNQPRYYQSSQIYASLLSYLSRTMESPDDFMQIVTEGTDRWGNEITKERYPEGYPVFPALDTMAKKYKWANQVIDLLTRDYLSENNNLRFPTTYGSMASQLYSNFFRTFIPYGKAFINKSEDGVLSVVGKIQPLNYDMADKMLYDKCVTNYKQRILLNKYSVYDKNGNINVANVQRLSSKYMPNEGLWNYEQKTKKIYDLYVETAGYDFDKQTSTRAEISKMAQMKRKKKELDDFTKEMSEDFKALGFEILPEDILYQISLDGGKPFAQKMLDINYLVRKLETVKEGQVYDYALDSLTPYGGDLIQKVADGMGTVDNTNYVQSFYDKDSKKTKYSYSADNYLQKTWRGLTNQSREKRRAYMDEHFKKYDWYYDKEKGKWKNKWLEFMYDYGDELTLGTTPYLNVDNVKFVGDEVNAGTPYTKWTTSDIFEIQRAAYNEVRSKGDRKSTFYLAPIFADSPMSMLVRGPIFNMDELLGKEGDYDGAFIRLVDQEMWRIKLVQDRAEKIKNGEIKAIANFDGEQGLKFRFMPELNHYTFENGENFLDRMVRRRKEGASEEEIWKDQKKAIDEILESRFVEYLIKNGITATMSGDVFEAEKLRFYNSAYAGASIIQLTCVDLAFSKNDTDFQKRFKQVYAAGTHLNTNSRFGKIKEKVILIADDIIPSPSYDKIRAHIQSQKHLSQADKDRICDIFKEINVADAQAIRSMHSFKSVLDMLGEWTDAHERALQHFEAGEWHAEDFDLLFQTIKPFAYSIIEKNQGDGNMMPVPAQHKNSEICALMMYDVICNDLKNSAVYRGLSWFMDNMKDSDGNPYVDMAQFESAGKMGNQGVINLSYWAPSVNNVVKNGSVVKTNGKNAKVKTILNNYLKEKYPKWNVDRSEDKKKYEKALADINANDSKAAKNLFELVKEALIDMVEKGTLSQSAFQEKLDAMRPTEEQVIQILTDEVVTTNEFGENIPNSEVVQDFPFADYHRSQPTPAHHIDAEATFGSQARNIAPADLPQDIVIKLKGKKKSARTLKGPKEVVDFYYELLNENLIGDYFGKGGLKEIFKDRKSFKEAVEKVTRGNKKYGSNFTDAMQLDENGEFIMSPNSPTLFHLMQEIVCSFFKNRITKQKITGAALIQAAGIGLDENLKLEFDKNGKPVAAHCYMPLTSKRFFEPLLKTKKEIVDGKEVEVKYLDVEVLKNASLDKAIGYRIPTENTSSMLPLIIDGFTPLQNGSCIVLPAEITALSGSDFDVDKMFVILTSFWVQEFDKKSAWDDYNKGNKLADTFLKGFFKNFKTQDTLSEEDYEEFLNDSDEAEGFREWFEENKENYRLKKPRIHKVEYDYSKPAKENSRKARNNAILQLMYEMLTSKKDGASILNPQGFPDLEYSAKVMRILDNDNLIQAAVGTNGNIETSEPDKARESLRKKIQDRLGFGTKEESELDAMSDQDVVKAYLQDAQNEYLGNLTSVLLKSSTKTLSKIIRDYEDSDSPIYPQAFQNNHARNMAGVEQIGIYAVQASMCAKYQRATVKLRNDDYMDQTYKLNIQRYDKKGELIEEEKTISDVDVSENGRRLKNVVQMVGGAADNGKNPNLTDFGSTTETAPMIGYMLRCGIPHLETALITKIMGKFDFKGIDWETTQGFLKPDEQYPVSTEDLIKAARSLSNVDSTTHHAIAKMCYKIYIQAEAMEYVTTVSRADSPNGAMGNSFAKARVQQYKVDLLQGKMHDVNFPFQYIGEALSNDAVDPSADEDTVREQINKQPMSFLHAMYALGINSLNTNASKFFFMLSPQFDERITKQVLYNMDEHTSEEKMVKTLEKMYEHYLTYVLSDSKLFGDELNASGNFTSMAKKRDWYINGEFADEYRKILANNPDIFERIGYIFIADGNRIVLSDAGSKSKQFNEDVETRLDELANSKNPVARDLVKNLLIYSYYSDGLGFSPVSFSKRFSTRFLVNFDAYTEALNRLDQKLAQDDDENYILEERFLDQFAAQNHDMMHKVKLNKQVKTGDGKLIFDMQTAIGRKMINATLTGNRFANRPVPYKYIAVGDSNYKLDEDLYKYNPSLAVYNKMPKYEASIPIYDINQNVESLGAEAVNYAVQNSSASSYLDQFSMGDPIESDREQDEFDRLVSTQEETVEYETTVESESELYKREGRSELEKELCK